MNKSWSYQQSMNKNINSHQTIHQCIKLSNHAHTNSQIHLTLVPNIPHKHAWSYNLHADDWNHSMNGIKWLKSLRPPDLSGQQQADHSKAEVALPWGESTGRGNRWRMKRKKRKKPEKKEGRRRNHLRRLTVEKVGNRWPCSESLDSEMKLRRSRRDGGGEEWERGG